MILCKAANIQGNGFTDNEYTLNLNSQSFGLKCIQE